MLEYFFVITYFDLSHNVIIAPTDDIYNHTIELLKKDETVASFFVVKGEQILSSVTH